MPPKPLPFEPQPIKPKKKPVPKDTTSSPKATPKATRDSMGIPNAVNRRLVRRAALFSGIPTSLGILTFALSYVVVSQHLLELPNTAVVLVSMLFFGIGVLGLSYGAISASWDEERVGSWWGWQEFQKNFSALSAAWQAQRLQSKSQKSDDPNPSVDR